MADEPKTKPDDSVPEQVHPVDPGIAAARAGQGRGRRPPAATEDPAKLRKEAAATGAGSVRLRPSATRCKPAQSRPTASRSSAQ